MTTLRAAVYLAFLVCLGACGGAGQAGAERTDNDPLLSVSGEELYRRGMLLAQAGDLVRAEQYLGAAIERGFPEERALPALLDVCIRASRLIAALDYAQPYLTRNPSQWPLRLLVASMHMGLGHHEQARAELERVLEDAAPEEPPQAHYFLAVLFRDELDDAEAATLHFRRYLALEPEGTHRDEARAGLPPAERGVPVRIEAHEVPAPEATPPEAAPPEAAPPEAQASEGKS